MGEKLNIGIIGTGNISTFHMAGYNRIPDKCKVVAVCDIDEKKVKAFADKYGINKYYIDYDKMLKECDLDALSVCTWNSAHKDAVISALDNKVHVLCEKPMSIDADQAKLMNEAALRNNRQLMIGFVRRFGNDTKILKSFIDDGHMGDIYYAKASYLRRNGCPGGWFKDSEYSGGGPLIDLSVHVMDLVRYLSGNPQPVSVLGVVYDNLGPDRAIGAKGYVVDDDKRFVFNVEDMAAAMITFDNGLTLFMDASFNLNIKRDTSIIELFGTQGGARIDPDVEIFTQMANRFVDITPSGDTALSFTGLFENEIEHFADSILNDTPCIATGHDGLVIMKIIDAIYKSALTGKQVFIE